MSFSEATSHLVTASPSPLSPVPLLVLAAQEHLALKQPNKKSHWEARSERGKKVWGNVWRIDKIAERFSDTEAAEKTVRLCKRVLGGCHNCRTGPLQMTSFTKSYFTRGYKGHTTFRALHPLQGRRRHSGFWFSFLPKNGHLLTVCLQLQCVIKGIDKLQWLLHVGTVTNSKGRAFACVSKGDGKV